MLDQLIGQLFTGFQQEASADPATAVPGYLRRLKDLAVTYSG